MEFTTLGNAPCALFVMLKSIIHHGLDLTLFMTEWNTFAQSSHSMGSFSPLGGKCTHPLTVPAPLPAPVVAVAAATSLRGGVRHQDHRVRGVPTDIQRALDLLP